MREYVSLTIISMFMAAGMLLTACRHNVDHRLVHAEDIMEEHPDSALIILEEMQLPGNAPEEDLALYNLLLTHARYKNFIDETNDSLIRAAAEYFTDKGDPEEASKAYFLAGMIEKNAGRLGEAAVSFLKGRDMARENRCHMWEGQCARGLFQLYNQLMDGSAQLQYAREAYDAFSKGGFEDWNEYASLNVATAHNNNRQYQDAIAIAKDLQNRSKAIHDTIILEESTYLLGLALSNLGDYEASIQEYAYGYRLNPKLLTENDIESISIAISNVNVDSLPLQARNFIEKIKDIHNYKSSFFVFADQGNYYMHIRNCMTIRTSRIVP